MGEQLRASAQYGDMRGTISIDGWEGLTAVGLGAAAGKGYWPVGIEIYGEPHDRGELDTDASVSILAVDTGILDGTPPDAVGKYAKEHGELPVFRFRSKLKLENLLPLLKRVSIVLQDRTTREVPLVLVGSDSIYGGEETNDDENPDDSEPSE